MTSSVACLADFELRTSGGATQSLSQLLPNDGRNCGLTCAYCHAATVAGCRLTVCLGDRRCHGCARVRNHPVIQAKTKMIPDPYRFGISMLTKSSRNSNQTQNIPYIYEYAGYQCAQWIGLKVAVSSTRWRAWRHIKLWRKLIEPCYACNQDVIVATVFHMCKPASTTEFAACFRTSRPCEGGSSGR